MSKERFQRAGRSEAMGQNGEDDDIATLADAIRERNAVLFAGAGISMTVGLPSWDELIEHLCQELDLDRTLYPPAEAAHLTLAEYYRLEKGSLDPLVDWMKRKWSVSEDEVSRSPAHQLLVTLDFPIIYTTNYDGNLEAAYRHAGRDYVKITSARDLAGLAEGVTQIVKFHGDFCSPESLVLGECAYFDRLDFESPLDLKFRADTLARTVLFVGYSMSDMNIRLLLYRLAQMWRRVGQECDRPRSFVFMPTLNPVQRSVLAEWGITVISGKGDDPQQSLIDFLKSLRDRVGAPSAQEQGRQN